MDINDTARYDPEQLISDDRALGAKVKELGQRCSHPFPWVRIKGLTTGDKCTAAQIDSTGGL